MMPRLETTSLALGLLGLLACGPPKGDVPVDFEAEALRFAEATCAARETCGCDDARYDSRQTCEDDLVSRFLAQVDAGLTFDADCFEAALASEAFTCAKWPYEIYDVWGCPALRGQAEEGDPCDAHVDLFPLLVTDCRNGLVCSAGTCARGPGGQTQSAGEPCKEGSGSGCRSGLWCGPDDICHPDADLGEPCTHIMACAPGVYCAGLAADGIGTCTESLPTGATCDPRDWNACGLPPWSWCAPAEVGGYTCEEGVPGICNLTFPFPW